MKRQMLNGEYLTKNDVRRKEKELQEKDGEEINNKEKANYEGAEKWEPASKLNFIWVFSYAKFQKKKKHSFYQSPFDTTFSL